MLRSLVMMLWVSGNALVSGYAEDDDTSEDIFIEMNGKRYKLVEVA
jgi:hypothetical protein